MKLGKFVLLSSALSLSMASFAADNGNALSAEEQQTQQPMQQQQQPPQMQQQNPNNTQMMQNFRNREDNQPAENQPASNQPQH